MTYYDPELANWLKGDAASKELAKDSIALAQAFGGLLPTSADAGLPRNS